MIYEHDLSFICTKAMGKGRNYHCVGIWGYYVPGNVPDVFQVCSL